MSERYLNIKGELVDLAELEAKLRAGHSILDLAVELGISYVYMCQLLQGSRSIDEFGSALVVSERNMRYLQLRSKIKKTKLCDAHELGISRKTLYNYKKKLEQEEFALAQAMKVSNEEKRMLVSGTSGKHLP